MSLVTAHMVYFCAFARSEINAWKLGVGRRQFDAGVNGLISHFFAIIKINKKTYENRVYRNPYEI